MKHYYLKHSYFYFAAVVSMLFACSDSDNKVGTEVTPPDCTSFVRPKVNGAVPMSDPTIFYDNGTYYLSGTPIGKADNEIKKTVNGQKLQGLTVLKSKDLQEWTSGAVDDYVYILSPQLETTFGKAGFGSPQWVKTGGQYYLFYNADNKISVAKSSEVTGPFKQKVVHCITPGSDNIDPYLFTDDDGKSYLYQVRFDNGNYIGVAAYDIVNGVYDRDSFTKCIDVTRQWEKNNDKALCLGNPSVIKKDGIYYMFYSVKNGSDSGVGYATSASPLGPWTKYKDNPIISSAILGEQCAGNGDVFEDKDGNLQYVYTYSGDADGSKDLSQHIVPLRSVAGTDGKPVFSVDASHIIKPAFKKGVISLQDVWTAYDAFNDNFFYTKEKLYKQKSSDTRPLLWMFVSPIWCQPQYWDMAMYAYKLALKVDDTERAEKYKKLSDNFIEGTGKFYHNFDFDYSNEGYGWFIYDDIQWWTITFARAYELFKDERYLNLSEAAFTRVWYGSEKVGDTGSYADPDKGLGGGMFWQWKPWKGTQKPNKNEAGDGKMACINFPTVVAAMTLYNNVPSNRTEDPNPLRWSNQYGDFVRPHYETKASYLSKAKEIYEWAYNNLVNKNTGAVADSKHGSQDAYFYDRTYNQGTYIGASCLLYKATGDRRYLDNAIKAADYVQNNMFGGSGILGWEHNNEEDGIFNTIFAEYMAMLIYDCGQKQYLPFMRRNAYTGWSNRDRVRNITGPVYTKPLTEKDVIYTVGASNIPAMMLLFNDVAITGN